MNDEKRLSIARGIKLSEKPGLGALTLLGFLAKITERFAPREAVVMHEQGGVMRWSYGQLMERALDMARALVALGVGKYSRVGILMTNGPWFRAALGEAWLDRLIEAERADRQVRSLRYQPKAARFPVHRDLTGIDWAKTPLPQAQIDNWQLRLSCKPLII